MEPRLITVGINMCSTLRARLVAKSCGEGLVEPQIVPPFHGNKIAEPHVTQFVLYHYTEESQFWNRHMLFTAHDLIRISDTTDVFHGTVFVIWAHHVVNFCERIPRAKVSLVEVQRRLRDAKH